MYPVSTVQDVLALIDDFHGPPEDFSLTISEWLFDPAGVHMALITDRILSRGWVPDSYEQCAGYRISRYKRMV